MTDATKPINPQLHGLADYGLVAVLLLAPRLLRLHGTARALCYFFAITQGTVNALTDQPFAYRRMIPFKMHGQLEKYSAPLFLGLPRITGATRTFRGSALFNLMFLLLVGVYRLTDWNAQPTQGQPRVDPPQALALPEPAAAI